MSKYVPDEWVVLEITGKYPHHRVMGSWFGGYAKSDHWRLNSGITDIDERDDRYVFHGTTGSEYHCSKLCYGITNSYNSGVLSDYLKREDVRALTEDEFEDYLAR